MTLTDIIARLEAAEGPDRWLDAKIDAAVRFGSEKMQRGYEWAWDNFPTWAHHKQSRGMCGVQHDNGDLGLIWDSPEFTASVDAAISLAERLLPGRSVMMGWRQTSETRPWARVGLWPDPDATGATPAIALVTATLRALSKQEEQNK